jgi:hypothetical protein
MRLAYRIALGKQIAAAEIGTKAPQLWIESDDRSR